MRVLIAFLALATVGESFSERLRTSSGCGPGDSSCRFVEVFTDCDDDYGPCGDGAVEATVVDDDGSVEGECAYVEPNGRNVKIFFRQLPNGKVYSRSNRRVPDVNRALQICRRKVAANREAAAREQEKILRQGQRIQEEIMRQHEKMMRNFRFF